MKAESISAEGRRRTEEEKIESVLDSESLTGDESRLELKNVRISLPEAISQ